MSTTEDENINRVREIVHEEEEEEVAEADSVNVNAEGLKKTPTVGEGEESGVGGDGEGRQSSEIGLQDGVKKVEAVTTSWSKWGLVIAYTGIFLLAFTTSIEQQTTYPLSVIATSAFANHSLVSTVTVVQQVVNAVIKPPMAKVADVLGRLEAFSFSVFLFIIGYIQMATSQNVQTFASAQIFYSAGGTGLQILTQVFIADTSDLLNRALWSSLPDVPFLITVWVGPIASQRISTVWRWGYGMWTIILPVAFLPLALSLFLNQRKADRLGLLPPSPWKNLGSKVLVKKFLREVDAVGILLLSTAFALILIPLTIAAKAWAGWNTPSIITMLILGPLCLVAFPFWEKNKRLAPQPLVPLEMLRSRTFCCGCLLGFFYFMAFYLSVFPYFYSYLLVVHNASITSAGHITQTFSFTATIASVIVSLAIKYTKRYKPFILLGSLIYLSGLGLMLHYRLQNSSRASIIGSQICVGIGGGILNVPAQLGIQASVPHQNVAAATAVFLTVVEIGGGVGAAISGTIWGRNIQAKLALYLPQESRAMAGSIFNDITVATGYAVGSPERVAIDRAYQETMQLLLIVALCVAVPVLPLGWCMRNYKLDELGQHVKGRVVGGIRNCEVEGERDGFVEQREKAAGGVLREKGSMEEDAWWGDWKGQYDRWVRMKGERGEAVEL